MKNNDVLTVSQSLYSAEKPYFSIKTKDPDTVKLILEKSSSKAIHKVISNPVRKWTDTNIERNIVGVKRLSRKNIRQIASKNNRMELPANMQIGMHKDMTSIPRCIEIEYKKDSVDNQENQFIKFVLRTFHKICIAYIFNVLFGFEKNEECIGEIEIRI